MHDSKSIHHICSFFRFIHVEEIDNPKLILWVGIFGLIVNAIGLCLFHGKLHCTNRQTCVVYLNYLFYLAFAGIGHGGSGHSHHTIKQQNHLTQIVATDDNENDERVTSPENAPVQPPAHKPKTATQVRPQKPATIHL